MQILVVHDSDGVYDAFTGTPMQINDSIRGSRYWENIVKRLDDLSEEEITVGVINNELHHDGDSEYGFTLVKPIDPPSMDTMTHEEKVKYFTDALNICKFGVSEENVDLMVSLYDLLLEKKGETSLKDIIHVKYEHAKRFPEPKPKEDENIQGIDKE